MLALWHVNNTEAVVRSFMKIFINLIIYISGTNKCMDADELLNTLYRDTILLWSQHARAKLVGAIWLSQALNELEWS